MNTALYLLLATGMLGGFDVIYFHNHKCRLYKLPSARLENATHALRALLYAALICAVTFVDASGPWVGLYIGLCALECINNVLDTTLEHASRAPQGGLPPGEYVLHVALSVLTGAALCSMLLDAMPRLDAPAHLSWRRPDLPSDVVPMVVSSLVVSLLFCAFETFHVFKLGSTRSSVSPQTPSAPSSGERAELV